MKKSTKILTGIFVGTTAISGAIMAPVLINQTKGQILNIGEQQHIEAARKSTEEFQNKVKECESQGKIYSEFTEKCKNRGEIEPEVEQQNKDQCAQLNGYIGENGQCVVSYNKWTGTDKDLDSHPVIKRWKHRIIETVKHYEKYRNWKVLDNKDGYPWKLDVEIEGGEFLSQINAEFYVKQGGKIKKVIDGTSHLEPIVSE